MTDALHQKLCFPLIVYSNHSVTLRLLTYSRTHSIYICGYDYCYYVTMYYYNLEICFIILIVQKRNNKKWSYSSPLVTKCSFCSERPRAIMSRYNKGLRTSSCFKIYSYETRRHRRVCLAFVTPLSRSRLDTGPL